MVLRWTDPVIKALMTIRSLLEDITNWRRRQRPLSKPCCYLSSSGQAGVDRHYSHMNTRYLSPSFTALLLLTLIYCASAARAQTNVEPATISGRITLDGQPARSIKVSLVPGPYGSPETPGRQSVRTDEEGNYEFKGLSAGRYGLLAASYVYVSDELFSLPSKPFKLCTVAAGEKLTAQDIRLVRGGVITGRVTDADGKPVILEPINLSFVEQSGKRQEFPGILHREMLETDDRGVYRCFGLLPGRYLVSVGKDVGGGSTTGRAQGFYRCVYYPGVAEAERAELVEVSPGGEVTGIDIRLGTKEKTFSARGRAIDAINGQAVPGAWTDFYLFDQRTKQLRPSSVGDTCNERGEFNFTGLLPGRYGIAGTPDSTRNYYGELVAFEIKDEDLTGLEIKLQRGANISGNVALDGAADATAALQRVRLWLRAIPLNSGDALPRDLPPSQVQANGSFQLKALPPGKVRLELVGGEHHFSLLRIERSGAVLEDAFDLKAGEQVTGVRVVLAQATGALRGRVILPSTDWPPEVSLRRVDGGEHLVRAIPLDAGNTFLAPTLAIGEYEIVVTLTSKNSNNNQPLEPLRRSVTVREGTTTEVLLQAEPRR